MLLEWRLSKPLLKYLCTFHLLMFSLAQTSCMVILSFRGMLRKASKSIGIALRPTLPFFKLETTTGTEFASCVFTSPPYALNCPKVQIKSISNNLGIFLVEYPVIASSQQRLINLLSQIFWHLFPSVVHLNISLGNMLYFKKKTLSSSSTGSFEKQGSKLTDVIIILQYRLVEV